MTEHSRLPLIAATLRERAINRLNSQSIPNVDFLSEAELRRCCFELQIQKAEQELHNEDLLASLRKTEAELADCKRLYEVAQLRAVPCTEEATNVTSRANETDGSVTLCSSQAKQEQERLHFQAQLLGAVGQAVIATDLAGTITYINPAAAALYGWSAEEVIGRNCVEALTSEATDEQSAAIMAQLARGESWSGEFVVRRRDHSTFLAMVTNSPIFNLAGEMVGIKGISQDIGPRKQTEAALQTTKDLLERAFHAISDGLVIQGPDGHIIQSNPAAQRILGLTADQIAGRSSLDPRWQAVRLDGSPFPGNEHPAMVTLRTGRPLHGVVMGIQKPNGSQTWIKIDTTLLSAGQGVLTSFSDITEQKASFESTNFQAQLLHAVGEAIVSVDLVGKIVYFNPAAEALYGWKSEEVLGRKITEVTALSMTESQRAELLTRLAKGEHFRTESPARHRNGSWFLIEIRNSPVRNAAGQLIGVIGVSQDITQRKKVEESLNFQAQLLSAVGQSVIATDLEGLITYVNPAAEALYGWKSEDVVGHDVVEITPSKASAEQAAAIMVQLGRGQSWSGEFQVQKRDGTEFWVEVTDTPIRNANGEVVGMAGVSQDITARKQAEQTLRNSERFIRTVSNHLPIGVSYWTPDLRCTFANPSAHVQFGVATDELVGRSLAEVLGNEQFRRSEDFLMAALKGEPQAFEWSRNRPGAQSEYFWIQYVPHVAEGVVSDLLMVVSDITELKRGELARSRLAAIVESANDAIASESLDGTILSWNPGCERLLGYRAEEIIGHSVRCLIPPDRVDEENQMVERVHRGELVEHLETTRLHKDGSLVSVELTLSPLRDESGRVVGRSKITHDITLRKKAEAELRLLNTCVASLRDVVMITEAGPLAPPGPRILFANPAIERLSGYPPQEIVGKPPGILHGPNTSQETLARVYAALRRGEVATEEILHYTKTGQEHLVELQVVPIPDGSGTITHYLSIQRDISDRKSLETQLRQAQKMEVIGQLAGGVAHDFNNILQVMMLNLELLAEHKDLPPDVRTPLHELEMLSERAATLTSQLLQFARRQAVQLRTVDLNASISKSVSLLRRLLGEHLTIKADLAPGSLWTEADAGMLDQVVMNLCINARDAMPKGGTLTIQTTLTEIREEDVQRTPQARPGRFVCLCVSDTGCGMSPAVLEHLFEPFFTTKEAGKGTGLGLAAVYGIVMQHRGFVKVDSVVSAGSSFRLYLPWSSKVAVPQARTEQSASRPIGAQTVLVVEDEELLRDIAVLMLQRQGYRVLSAADGVEALRLWEQHGPEIDLLISDMVMPGGLTGMALCERLLEHKPQLRVILMSGYSDEIIARESNPRANITLLAKPFRYQELLDITRQSLQ